MSPDPTGNPQFDSLTQGQKVRALWLDAMHVREDYDKAIGEELDFSLKLRHYVDDAGETRDRRRIQPKGRELISKLRHKVGEITKDRYITVKPVDKTTDPKSADAAKWVLEYDTKNPQKDFDQVVDDWVTCALAGRLGMFTLDYIPGIGAFGGEIVPRVMDPRHGWWTPGWKNPHDLTCPWFIELRRMRLSDIRKMKDAGWKNVEEVHEDGGIGEMAQTAQSVLPGTVSFPRGTAATPVPGMGLAEPRATVLLAWFKNDDTRTERMKENGLRKLRPDQRYLKCPTCQYEDRHTPGEELPAHPELLCPTCGMVMDRVDQEIETDQVLAYPNGRLTIVAPFSDDTVLYDDNWPIKIRSFPYFPLHGYPHPLEQIGMSDTAYDWSLQLITDALLRQAYEQMSENREIIVAPVDGLVDADGEPWQFADTQGRIAYWTAQGSPGVQFLQGHGVSPGWREIFGQVQSVLMRDMGTSDIAIGSENTRNIPVGTVRAMQETGEVPVEHHKRRMWRALSIALGVWLDMIRDTWTEERMVRLSPENGQEFFQSIRGSDIPNADIEVTAEPSLGRVDAQEIQALQQVFSAPPPQMKLLARKLNVSAGDLAEYEQEMAKFQESNKPQPPPSSPSDILVAISDLIKVDQSLVSRQQVQAALAMAGLPPQAQPDPEQMIHSALNVHKKIKDATPDPIEELAGASPTGKGSQPPKKAASK